jgi:hypothetical protein
MHRPLALATLALALLSPIARAQDAERAPTLKVEIDGRTISLPAPFGYCDLDPDRARDKTLIEAVDALPRSGRSLRRMAPCDELKVWRQDNDADPIEVVVFLSAEGLGTAGEDRRAFLRRAVPGEVLGKAKIVERAGQGFPSDASERAIAVIGLVERNDRAALQAQAAIARLGAAPRRLIGVTATTAIGPTPVVIEIWSPYDDGSELDWMLRDAREHVDRLLSASGETSRRFRESRPPRAEDGPPGDVSTRRVRVPRERAPGFFDAYGGYIALGMLVGGALLIGVGMLIARRLRPAP